MQPIKPKEILKNFEIDPKIIKEFSSFQVRESYSKLVHNILPSFVLPKKLHQALDFTDSKIDKLKNYSELWNTHPAERDHFVELVKGVKKSKDAIRLEDAMDLSGIDNTRNLLVVIEVVQALTGKKLAYDEAHKPKLNVDQTLRYAIKLENELEFGHPLRYLAYEAGLMYDFMHLYAEYFCPNHKSSVQNLIQETTKEATLTAKLSIKIAERVKKLELSNYLFSACLLQHSGEILLHIAEPSYGKFLAQLKKEKTPLSIRILLEREKYQLDHYYFSYMLVSQFPAFKSIKECFFHLWSPFRLQKEKGGIFELSQAVRLADAMTRSTQLPEKEDSPQMDHLWLRPEIREFQIQKKDLLQVAKKFFASGS